MTDIVLSTLNARYIHCSLGLRYLRANMTADIRARSDILEFVINSRAEEIVEALLAENPLIVGFGVYIWNVEETSRVVAMLKAVSPATRVVIGGPEVSFETDSAAISQHADYVITGQADHAFSELCEQILSGEPPATKLITPLPFKLSSLAMPYAEYTEDDVANRVVYVEASRGCPFKCEFCLSALDKTAVSFDLDEFLGHMERLFDRGVRHFKFVDRTFNLKIEDCRRILDFFLARLDEGVFVHFELIPDRLPDALKEKIVRFPTGRLQFEIGVQTLNPEVQALISRKQDNASTLNNLRWLVKHTDTHLHTDLILGLPGESWESIARGFDTLLATGVSEIQVGILKRLRGAPIIRHTEQFQLVFNSSPPYNILQTSLLSFEQIQRLSRFARYWDMVGNSGRFKASLPLILGPDPFDRFMVFCDWLYAREQRTHNINIRRLFQLVYMAAIEVLEVDRNSIFNSLQLDYSRTGQKGRLKIGEDDIADGGERKASLFKRQARHTKVDAVSGKK